MGANGNTKDKDIKNCSNLAGISGSNTGRPDLINTGDGDEPLNAVDIAEKYQKIENILVLNLREALKNCKDKARMVYLDNQQKKLEYLVGKEDCIRLYKAICVKKIDSITAFIRRNAFYALEKQQPVYNQNNSKSDLSNIKLVRQNKSKVLELKRRNPFFGQDKNNSHGLK